MQPDDHQYSIDYLNSIAAPAKKPTMSPVLLWAMIGGVLLLVAVVGFMLAAGGGGSSSNLQSVALRLQSLQQVTTDSQPGIQSTSLRTLNSSLTLLLTNANREAATPLADAGIKDLSKVKDSPVQTEMSDLSARLEDARLNAVYDRTYAREISFQLQTLRVEMTDLYERTNSASLKTFLQDTDKNLEPLTKQFSEFNAANG